jgi:transposase InsO family protein
LVLKIRRENPTYGKEKIAVILKRDFGWEKSESTVGRILKSLMEKGFVVKSASALRTKKKRIFGKHAKPWTFKEYEKMELGERVQVDHMTVTKNGLSFKHFQAWERKSRHLSAQIYCSAKSSDAKKFLLEFVEKAPYEIKSIQVDGGSEFMLEFERACEELGIPLIVLPPASPKYNGGVERANRTLREEFYGQSSLLADSIGAMRFELRKNIEKYNNYRPHKGLKGKTPMAYINSTYSEVLQSHFI